MTLFPMYSRPACAAQAAAGGPPPIGHLGDGTMRTFGKLMLAFGALALMAAPAWRRDRDVAGSAWAAAACC